MMELPQFLQQNIQYLLFAILLLFMLKNRILSKVVGLQAMSVQDAFEVFKTKPKTSIFLDIRTSWELEKDPKIKTSKWIPLSELSNRMPELEKLGAKEKTIIVVCRTGSRARSAGIKLKRAGYSDVYVMSGGVMSWQRADYPVNFPKVKKRNQSIG